MSSPDVLIRNKVFVDKCLVDLLQDIHALSHLPKNCVNPIQVIQALICCNKKLENGEDMSIHISVFSDNTIFKNGF